MGPVAGSQRIAASVSVVAVVEDRAPEAALLDRIAAQRYGAALRDVANLVPDAKVLLLARRIDKDVARRLIAINNVT